MTGQMEDTALTSMNAKATEHALHSRNAQTYKVLSCADATEDLG